MNNLLSGSFLTLLSKASWQRWKRRDRSKKLPMMPLWIFKYRFVIEIIWKDSGICIAPKSEKMQLFVSLFKISVKIQLQSDFWTNMTMFKVSLGFPLEFSRPATEYCIMHAYQINLWCFYYNYDTDQIVWIEDQEKNSRQPLLFTWFHNFGQPGRHRQKWNLYL